MRKRPGASPRNRGPASPLLGGSARAGQGGGRPPAPPAPRRRAARHPSGGAASGPPPFPTRAPQQQVSPTSPALTRPLATATIAPPWALKKNLQSPARPGRLISASCLSFPVARAVYRQSTKNAQHPHLTTNLAAGRGSHPALLPRAPGAPHAVGKGVAAKARV